MNTYEKAVAANMQHMQTSLADWQAVEIAGFSDTTDDKGNAVKMPTFNFPAGYSPAPTLYKAQAAACCELCAHDIKNVYWLQNDSKRWLLAVGSECVTRFTGKSGEQLAGEVRDKQNRELILTLLAQHRIVKKCFSFRVQIGYGRTQQAWTHAEARELQKELFRLLGKIEADSTPAAMASFVTRKGEQARALAVSAAQFLKSPASVGYAIRCLERKRSEFDSVLKWQRTAGRPAAQFELDTAAELVARYDSRIAKIKAAGDCFACAN